MAKLKVYVAGKVSKESTFKTHYWRDAFIEELETLTKIELINIDPTKSDVKQHSPETVFGADVLLIQSCDVLIVYLSDDISVGGSQEILIAKYYNKPVIGLAPMGGKFQGAQRVLFGKKIASYKDPFVFTTCDVVAPDIEGVAVALKNLDKMTIKSLDIIDELSSEFKKKHLNTHDYIASVIEADAKK